MSIEKVRQEIIDWHQFLHKFFRGENEVDDFTRMVKVLTPEFQYISVWGEAGGRKLFLTEVPKAYGAFPDLDVYVEDIHVQELAPDLYLASFIQVETFPDLPHKRYTTGVLRMEEGIAKWVRFHLTLIDQTRRPNLDAGEDD
jgi:hypothetical protein